MSHFKMSEEKILVTKNSIFEGPSWYFTILSFTDSLIILIIIGYLGIYSATIAQLLELNVFKSVT